jgi:hypothetical protein
MAIWYILQPLGIFYDHLVHFVYLHLVIFSGFGTVKNLATLLRTSTNSCKRVIRNVNCKTLPLDPRHFVNQANLVKKYLKSFSKTFEFFLRLENLKIQKKYFE